MKDITKFRLVDLGLKGLTREEATEALLPGWDHVAQGWGTDAESALDTLLHNLQANDFDVVGLEWQIKNIWNPTEVEGDGKNIYYHLYLCIKTES
jgi:hypothetical protein